MKIHSQDNCSFREYMLIVDLLMIRHDIRWRYSFYKYMYKQNYELETLS